MTGRVLACCNLGRLGEVDPWKLYRGGDGHKRMVAVVAEAGIPQPARLHPNQQALPLSDLAKPDVDNPSPYPFLQSLRGKLPCFQPANGQLSKQRANIGVTVSLRNKAERNPGAGRKSR